MDILTLLLIILVVIAIYLIVKKYSKKRGSKPAYVKKAEITDSYRNKMRKIVSKYKNSDNLFSQKSAYLKQVNAELHNNIFFTDQEVKEIIQELASI